MFDYQLMESRDSAALQVNNPQKLRKSVQLQHHKVTKYIIIDINHTEKLEIEKKKT